jgi:hypothetical protein
MSRARDGAGEESRVRAFSLAAAMADVVDVFVEGAGPLGFVAGVATSSAGCLLSSVGVAAVSAIASFS